MAELVIMPDDVLDQRSMTFTRGVFRLIFLGPQWFPPHLQLKHISPPPPSPLFEWAREKERFATCIYLAVSLSLESDVISMIPSFVWQTHDSDLPGAGAHFVPVGSAEDGKTSTRLWINISKITDTTAMILYNQWG